MILDKTGVLIKTENLSKSYKSKNDAKEGLNNINIKVTQGEFVIIKGIKGIEKNIFFNLMGCIERPSAGKLYFDYEDIGVAGCEMLDAIRRYKLGYLFRNFNLIPWMSVEENLTMPLRGLNISKDQKASRLEQVLRQFDIADIAGERMDRVFNFQKQMVALARAVINNPLMILADEPAANLNTHEEQKFMEHLWKLNHEGIAIMLISEQKEGDFLSTPRYIYFKNGRILEDTKGNHTYPGKGALI